MKNAAAVAHSGAGHYNTRDADVTDRARFVCGRRRFHRLRVAAQRAIAYELFHLVVEKLHVLDVNVRCFDSHRAVEELVGLLFTKPLAFSPRRGASVRSGN